MGLSGPLAKLLEICCEVHFDFLYIASLKMHNLVFTWNTLKTHIKKIGCLNIFVQTIFPFLYTNMNRKEETIKTLFST